MAEIISVRFRSEGKQYYFDPQGMVCRPGDGLIVETASGLEYAQCVRGNFTLAEAELAAPLRPVVRAATEEDLAVVEKNREKEVYAFRVCQEKILEHKLDMKLVSVECSFEGTKILFFFTSDGRVDFRGLVKSLAAVFHTRIELRQIGIRDEAKMLGGLGICGRPFCCNSFLREFQPVSIKMAKTQNLSLNPTKISGTCGRLMCCLKYEQDAYEDLIRSSPKLESFVDTPEGRGTVVELDLLRQRVKVRMEENPETVSVFPNADIAVLRSGKARKNDPPIPADLAPISGNGKRAPQPKEAEQPMMLEPIRFRYSTESVVSDEPAEQPEAAQQEMPRPNNRRRRRQDGPRQERPERQERQERQQPKPAAPAEEAAPESGERKPRRRPNYRRRRGGRGNGPAPKENEDR